MHLKKSGDQFGTKSLAFPADLRPHKRPIANHPISTVDHSSRPVSAVRSPAPSLRLRILFLLSFPSLFFILLTFSSSSSSYYSFLVNFFSAVALSSSILFLLSLSLNLFSHSSLRDLVSRYRRVPHRPVQWSIGSAAEKPKSDTGITSGFFVQVYSNGDVYEGEFHKGKCSGSGVYYYYMSGRYEGDWVDDKHDGYGIETWAKGSRYKGQYRHGLRHGFGVYRFYTGDLYTGEWMNGQSDGFGLHSCGDGSRYVGGFKCGIKHGLGHYHFRCDFVEFVFGLFYVA